jgi:hypothetical protein
VNSAITLKRLLTSLIAGLVASVVLSSTAHGAAFDPDRISKTPGDITIQISEPGTVQNHSKLAIQPPAPDENLNRDPWRWCESLDDPVCDFGDKSLDIIGTMIMPVCDSLTVENCVESFSVAISGSNYVGQFDREAEGGIKWPADPDLNFFKAGSPLLFRVPGAIHGGGTDQYAVIAMAATKFDFDSQKFQSRNLSISVVPYTEVIDPRYDPASIGSGDNNSCVFVETSVCGIREDFAPNSVVSVKVRAPKEISGWFMGRLKDPTVAISELTQTNNILAISANPAEVARFAILRPEGSLSLEDRRAMGNVGSWGSLGGIAYGTEANQESVFGMLDYYRAEAKDTAAGINTLWSVGTIQAPNEGCLADKSKVLGIVSTNAMIYNGGTPSYDNGYLSYKVGGLHFQPDGKTEVLGTYDLIMRSETARCLYGFSKAPVSATVQVVGTAGEEKVATTVVSERDGWLKLAAYGFTFSEKEVRVTLTQAPQPKRVSANLSKFTGKATKLNASQRAAIESIISQTEANSIASCTAYFVKAADKKLAETRAKAACAYAQGLNPKLKFTSTAKQTRTKSLDGRVTVVSN